jgi:hypothetical protein
VRDVEGEYTRLETEGPASHRRKDLLDKATKEVSEEEEWEEMAGSAGMCALVLRHVCTMHLFAMHLFTASAGFTYCPD